MKHIIMSWDPMWLPGYHFERVAMIVIIFERHQSQGASKLRR